MNANLKQYNDICFELSKKITESYSTSFTHGIKTLGQKYHMPIFAIYGFVRLADEIVDSFHEFNKAELLKDFVAQTYKAIEDKISTNTVLHAFQLIVNEYNIERELIDAFLLSMEMDLDKKVYNKELYTKYIYGSAEVVGLMCLHVFVSGNVNEYQRLREPARKLGAAFQKVNFLRDMKSDFADRGRVYFPSVDFAVFDDNAKKAIEADIDADFAEAYHGIMQLPEDVRPGVYTAYIYYLELLKKIKGVSASEVLKKRFRIADSMKFLLLLRTHARFKMGIS
ncbi:MAG: phytoene/squalene synthase family protein [Bacteroidetes bacterium]|nr:phytoene/squalene synthase family protein [Bacteroidota bacterium]